MVPKVTESGLLLLNRTQCRKVCLSLAVLSLWIANFALSSILNIPHELVAIFSKYNALFVMSHKPIIMILTDCNEFLRVTREEVTGLTQLYYIIQLSVMHHPAEFKNPFSHRGKVVCCMSSDTFAALREDMFLWQLIYSTEPGFTLNPSVVFYLCFRFSWEHTGEKKILWQYTWAALLQDLPQAMSAYTNTDITNECTLK